jgi:hypothetical protein
LSNGVDWSVAVSGTAITQGWCDLTTAPVACNSDVYQWQPIEGTQTWTFSTPVNLSFEVSDLQNPNEGVVLPLGTICDTSSANAAGWNGTFNAATATLIAGGTLTTFANIPCTLNGTNITTLTLDNPAVSNPTYSRGLGSLTVTPATITAQFSNLPPSLPPGQTATGVTLTCANAGPGPDAINADCVPSVTSGGGTISNLSCTPGALPVNPLQDGDEIVCTFDLTAPNTPTVDIQLQGKATADGLDDAVATGLTAGARLLFPAAGAATVPTLGQWTLALLALLTLGGAALGMRRKQG